MGEKRSRKRFIDLKLSFFSDYGSGAPPPFGFKLVQSTTTILMKTIFLLNDFKTILPKIVINVYTYLQKCHWLFVNDSFDKTVLVHLS